MIPIDAVWLATEPMDMRAGTETALARVVRVFGAARPHHAYPTAQRILLARLVTMKVDLRIAFLTPSPPVEHIRCS